MSRVTTVDLLRHGECAGGNIMRGRIDVPLTDDGWKQMASAVSQIEQCERIITSPLRRCQRFAEDLGETRRLSVHVEHDLREMDFGELDGQSVEESLRRHPELMTALYRQPDDLQLPGGESFRAFAERVVGGFDTVLQRFCGEHLLIVTHGGVIRVLLMHLLQTPWSSTSRLHVPYACHVRFQIHGEGAASHPVLSLLNTREH